MRTFPQLPLEVESCITKMESFNTILDAELASKVGIIVPKKVVIDSSSSYTSSSWLSILNLIKMVGHNGASCEF
jgi:hypothetical protein